MIWLRGCIFTTFFLWVSPLYSLMSLKQLALLQLVEIAHDQPEDILDIYELIPPTLQHDFAEALDQKNRAILSGFMCEKLKSFPFESQDRLYAKHGYYALCYAWLRQPYCLRQKNIKEDFQLIAKGEIPSVNAENIKLTAKEFDQLISFSFLVVLNLNQTITSDWRVERLQVSTLVDPHVVLPHLRSLSIADCQLKAGFVLKWFSYLPNLSNLDISGNPISQSVVHKLGSLPLISLRANHCSLGLTTIEMFNKKIGLLRFASDPDLR